MRQARGKSTKTKKNSENIKKRLTCFFDCDKLYIVKGNESHENKRNQAIREIDQAPRTNRNESPAET